MSQTRNPTRKRMTRSAAKGNEIRVEHLINSLYQMEIWCKAIRKALGCLNPDTCLPCPPGGVRDWTTTGTSPLRVTRGCPPPEDNP